MPITAIFWDLGGVLLSNAWDRDQRAAAVTRFSLDAVDFEDRHREVVGALETGRCTLGEYLRAVVFHAPRPFGEAEFRNFMREQSSGFAENLAVVDELAATGRYLLATLNNESRALNDYRIERFELRSRFSAFFCSAYVGAMKPDRAIYRAALDITQRAPGEVVFVDDRPQNVEGARALGWGALYFRAAEGPDALRAGLREMGIVF